MKKKTPQNAIFSVSKTFIIIELVFVSIYITTSIGQSFYEV